MHRATKVGPQLLMPTMLYESTPEITHPRPNVAHSNEALSEPKETL